jgi:hypothetical protein
MAATLDIRISSPSGTRHQKTVVIGGKTFRMTTITRSIRGPVMKSKIRILPKLGTDLAR